MNEIEFRNSGANAVVDAYDNFAQQFSTSLVLQTREGDGPIYWHGRTIGLGDINADNIWEPYRLVFLGQTYSEKIFRHKLESDEIIIERFDIEDGSLRYATDVNPSGSHIDQTTVTYTAIFKGTINGQQVPEQRVSVTQKIRRTYLTYDTQISLLG